MPGDLVPIIAIVMSIGLPMMMGMVAILLAHQRKMAEFHARRGSIETSELEAMRSEMRELKQLVHQQVMAIDSLASSQRPPSTDALVQERVVETLRP